MRFLGWAIIALFFCMCIAPGAKAECSYVGPAIASAPNSDGIFNVPVNLEYSQTTVTGEERCNLKDLASCEGDSVTCGHFYGCHLSRVSTGPSSWTANGTCLFQSNRNCAAIDYHFRLSPTNTASIEIQNSKCVPQPLESPVHAVRRLLEYIQYVTNTQ